MKSKDNRDANNFQKQLLRDGKELNSTNHMFIKEDT